MTNVVPDLHMLVAHFNGEVLGLPIPRKPEMLGKARKEWALTALNEELTEFKDAETMEDEVDALIDLVYFALGRVVEMGIAVRPVFEEVHKANMAKKRGELSKRPNSMGYDAVKPEGWTPPDIRPLLEVSYADLETLHFMSELKVENPVEMSGPSKSLSLFWPGRYAEAKPKVLVLGYGRHGKDTVCEIMRDEYDLSFTSSSFFCAEAVVLPAARALWDNREGKILPKIPNYADAESCYNDRHNFREFWYETIRDFNRPDPTKLGRAIFEEHDVYCGLRSKAEFHGLINSGIPAFVVWVDASDRLPPEDKASCSVEPWMADYIIDNNGSLEELQFNVQQLMNRLEVL